MYSPKRRRRGALLKGSLEGTELGVQLIRSPQTSDLNLVDMKRPRQPSAGV